MGFDWPNPSAVCFDLFRVQDPESVKHRVHLELATTSEAHQAEWVARLKELGATPADVGQGDMPWTVTADPAGKEFSSSAVADAKTPSAPSWWYGLPGAGVDLLGDRVEYDPEGGGRLRADPLDFGRVFTLSFAVSRSARAGSLVATSTSSRSKASWTALVVRYTEVDGSAARRRGSP